ncbi:hypothetical protein [Pedobacter gandavensis]|uniref:Uncharacterized protein n=1 Tax=Pedobacter gandavensis TaxID=2679963 RepID=A0ABR6EUV4_9SPHI|nr:hypothetical protein [Pedobacter gandavensis]MBB2148827.1 hypothetical protein [Pedobacter gandavensis]
MESKVTQNEESNVTYIEGTSVSRPACTGTACGSVGYQWDNGNVFSNLTSDKNIDVTIKNWGAAETGHLSPGESKRFNIKTFEEPFVANFV